MMKENGHSSSKLHPNHKQNQQYGINTAANAENTRLVLIVGITACLTYCFTITFHSLGWSIGGSDESFLDHRHFRPDYDTNRVMKSLFPPIPPHIDTGVDYLPNLDRMSTEVCADGLRRVNDQHLPESHVLSGSQKIPKIVFQTSKSRCLTPLLHKNANRWKHEGWSYYFYDDDAVMRLFSESFDEFPLLRGVAYNCMDAGAIKADVWRYLALYKYGGIYADVDSGFTDLFDWDKIIQHDAWLVVDVAFLPSQYFIAVAPRHPLMYYAVHHAILTLLRAPDTGLVHIAHGTGPWALFRAFRSFRQDVGVYNLNMPPFKIKPESPIKAGTWVGTHGRTVTFEGEGGFGESGKIVVRERVTQQIKQAMFEKMGMSHHWVDQKKKSGRLCLEALTMIGSMPDFSTNETYQNLESVYSSTSTSSSSLSRQKANSGNIKAAMTSKMFFESGQRKNLTLDELQNATTRTAAFQFNFKAVKSQKSAAKVQRKPNSLKKQPFTSQGLMKSRSQKSSVISRKKLPVK